MYNVCKVYCLVVTVLYVLYFDLNQFKTAAIALTVCLQAA
jgi:hypothetical protein